MEVVSPSCSAVEAEDNLRNFGNDLQEESPLPACSLMPTKIVNFSSGNPRIEETRGVMHLFPENPSCLPVGRKPLLSVIGVPNHMTYADFCQFCGAFIDHVLEMRAVRTDGVEDRYSLLMRFDDQSSSDKFYNHFNNKRYNSLEEDFCSVLFTVDVQFTGHSASFELAHPSSTSITEKPSCPVCLERLDQEMNGILTTICNHSFHCSCISKWTDSSCPVCRYCQEQPEKSICFACQTTENLWICVICGIVGCGRYKGAHAVKHWKETQHCYSLELETHKVWDYVGDNYVHRLIQTKTDGQLVELHANCDNGKDGYNQTLLHSKVEVMVNEYNELLATQLENQKNYFESLLQEVRDDNARTLSEAVSKAISSSSKLQKLQAKLDRSLQERKFLGEVNENLLKNKDIWIAKISQIEAEENKEMRKKMDAVENLQAQLEHLLSQFESEETVDGKI